METNLMTQKNLESKSIVAWIFFSLSVTLLLISLLSIVDNIFTICSWDRGMFTPEITCPTYFSLFEVLMKGYYFVLLVSALLLWLSVPLLIFLCWICFYSFGTINRDIELLKERSETEGLTKLVFFKRTLIAFPVILVFSWVLVIFTAGNSSLKASKSRAIENSNALVKKDEQRFMNIASKNRDYCEDAPEGLVLIYNKEEYHPALRFPKGYFKGSVVAYLSRENTWDGIISSKEWSDFYTFTLAPVDLSNKSEILFNLQTSLNGLIKGGRYDLRVFVLSDARNFDRGFVGGESITSSALTTVEKCLTVIYR